MYSLDINYNNLKKLAQQQGTPEMRDFIESKIGRDQLGKMSEEAWMDFLLGASLYGISVGMVKVI